MHTAQSALTPLLRFLKLPQAKIEKRGWGCNPDNKGGVFGKGEYTPQKYQEGGIDPALL